MVYATVLKCTGMYTNGDILHLFFDDKSNTINVDGDIHKIESSTVGNNGLATENFQNKNGKTVYLSLVNDKGQLDLKIFEPQKAGADKLTHVIHLACTKE